MLGILKTRWGAGAAAAVLLTAVAVAQSATPAANSADAKVLQDFSERVNAYLELRKHSPATSAKPTAAPDTLVKKQNQTAEQVREERPNAKQGDIFTPEIAHYFRRQIAATMAGPNGAKIRASLHHAEPVRGVPLQVNAPYPPDVPRQSTPPSLLLNLPPLPRELEYRIVDHDLVLLDSEANLIVDFIPGGLPAS